MGQTNCNCANQNKIRQMPKGILLKEKLLAEYQLSNYPHQGNKQNEEGRFNALKSSPKHPKQFYHEQLGRLPAKFTNLFMHLCLTNQKYEDAIFPCEDWAVSDRVGDGEIINWLRLSQIDSKPQTPNHGLSKTKLTKVLNFMTKNYPHFCHNIKPIYLDTTGFALCIFYIHGRYTEILIDDRIPSCYYDSQLPTWILLCQKAFAKVLSSYRYINEFTVGELFTELSGLPYYLSTETGAEVTVSHSGQKQRYQSQSFSSFKDALKCDEVLFQTQRYSNDVSVLGYRNKFQLFGIDFSTSGKSKCTLIKFNITHRSQLSLRVCQENIKYLLDDRTSDFFNDDTNNQSSIYSLLYVQLFKSATHAYQPYGSAYRFENCLYVNDVFTEMETGKYMMYIRNFSTSNKLSVLAYSQNKIKFVQIFDDKQCLQFYPKLALQAIELRDQLIYQQFNSVFISINTMNNAVLLKFDHSYQGKIIRIRQNCYFENQCQLCPHGQRELRLDKVHGKWVILLWMGKMEAVNVKQLFVIADD